LNRPEIQSIKTNNDKEFSSDLIVANVDIKRVYQHFLKKPLPPKIRKSENSSSALIFYWGIKKTFPELDIHNIFFSNNYQEEFDAIFNRKTVQQDPTVYINITSKMVNNDAPANGENWFVMINVPHNSGQNWAEFTQIAKSKIIKKLSHILQQNIEELIEVEAVLDPVLIESNTGSDKGSLYGSSSNQRMSAFFRQANFSSEYRNLYFCGGSVHPGGGIPLCLLGAQIVNRLVPQPTTK
jgi:phytoene dehydrogenase-like protein